MPEGIPRINGSRTHALLIEGEKRLQEQLRSMLLKESCDVYTCTSTLEAISQLQGGRGPDIAFINSTVQGDNGMSALEWFCRLRPTTPAVAICCPNDLRSIVDALRVGAIDVMVPPFGRLELSSCLSRYLEGPLAQNQTHTQAIPLTPSTSFVLCSDQMRTIALQCDQIARTDLPVLILGESGTGKEILAHYIHKQSACSAGPFLKVNCAAMPADLLESELFGYEPGAFTGALKSKPGKFELCERGTIFLDEIGEMPPALQSKLLQVLQDGSFSRLGGRTTVRVNVRVIAATNIDIKTAIAERRFRGDLYYRLNGFSFCLPPLRKRREEIPVLIRYFMERMAEKYAGKPVRMSGALLNACMEYHWPGNLRELENFIKRYLVLGDERAMLAELVREHTLLPLSSSKTELCTPVEGLKHMLSNVKGELEARVISAVLQRNQWKRKRSAAELKISYQALLYKMRQHGIVAPSGESIS